MQNILTKNLIKEFGLDKLPKKEQEETFLKIGEIIYKAVLIRIVGLLDNSDQNALEKLFDARNANPTPKNEKAVMDFLQKTIPNLEEIVKEEIINFKKDALDIMSKVKK